MAVQKQHHFLFSSTLVYTRKEDDSEVRRQKSKPFNAIVTTGTKLVTYELMDRARKAILQRAWDEMGVPIDDVLDYHVHNFSYMGLMSSEEFNGRKAS
jgi:hypothetical protein